MQDIREGFTHFWEILTGVFDDDRSKLLRIMSFVMLFMGCIWAGLNYFKADRIADLSQEMEVSSHVQSIRGRNEAMEKLMEAAKAVGTMRRGGEAIANAISEMNTSPFNIDGYNEYGIEDLSGLSEFAPEAVPEREEQRQEVLIKALMISGRNRYAVIDYAAARGAVIRQGQELPGGGGRVVRITAEGITVRDNGKEYTYSVK